MSGQDDVGFQGLTPFEFALAGVTPPDGLASSSVEIIDDMRRMLDEVVDAPVVRPELQDFLDSGGPLAAKNDRRAHKPDPPPQQEGDTGGVFIDITPAEFAAAASGEEAAADDREPDDPTGTDGESAEGPAGDELALGAVITGRLRSSSGRFSVPDEDAAAGPRAGELASSEAGELDLTATGPVAGTSGADPEPSEPASPTPPTRGSTSDPATVTAPLLIGDEHGDSPHGDLAQDDAERVGGRELAAASAPGLLSLTPTSPPLTAPSSSPGPVELDPGGFRAVGLAALGAAAAVVLIAGGLWWASSNSDRNSADGGDLDEVAAAADEDGDESGNEDGSTAESDGSESDAASESSDSSTSDALEPSSDLDPSTSTEITATPSSVSRSVTSDGTGEPGEGQQTTTGQTTATTATSSTETTATTQVTTTTTRRTTTTQATTTPTTAPPAPASIGDQVTVGNSGGRGLAGVRVELWATNGRNGPADRNVATQTTDSSGKYSFREPAGCYEVRFSAPAGYEMQDGSATRRLCVDAGGSATNIDAVALKVIVGPSGCSVDPAPGFGAGWGLGVEVYENEGDWADGYIFYGQSGEVVARSSDLDPPAEHSPTVREWYGSWEKFHHRNTYSVAAIRGGTESDPVSCRRA